MPDVPTILLFITAISAFGTAISTVLLALYKRREMSENRRGVRYKDISPTGFDLLEKAYRRVDSAFDRPLDFDEILKDIAESSGLSDHEKTSERLRAIDALKTLTRIGCLRKRDDGGDNVYVMTERGLRVWEYRREKRWWKVWMRPPL